MRRSSASCRSRAWNGEEFIRLRRQIEELRPLRERQASARRTEKEHADRRRSLLAEWEDFKAQEFRRLDGAANGVNKKLRGRVQVEVTAAGDREPLFNLLRDKVGGRLSEAIESLRGVRDLSLTQFVEACRSGAEALHRTFGITPAQGERLAKAEPEVLMHVEELDLPPTTAIRLNTAPAGEPPAWQALEDLSTGQKATAVLLLLLLESEAPLIVDQPEDDLDNRFITEGVVPRMREEKQRRQFPFLHPQRQHPGPRRCRADRRPFRHWRGRARPRAHRPRAHGLDRCQARARAGRGDPRRRQGSLRAPAPEVRVLRSGAMNRTELEELIRNGENSGVELKRDDVVPERLAKELAALLNLEGGHLLLGVEDDGTVTGLTRAPKQVEEWIMEVARAHLRPAPFRSGRP